jgi:hypothetical protein
MEHYVLLRNSAKLCWRGTESHPLIEPSGELVASGGYDVGELSPHSPVKEIKEFLQDLVLIARSVIMIKAFSKRFHIRWSLVDKWAPIARKMLHGSATPTSADLSHHHHHHQFCYGKM